MCCDDCGMQVERDKSLRFANELVNELLENYDFDGCRLVHRVWLVFCESNDQTVLVENPDFVGERVVSCSVLVSCQN